MKRLAFNGGEISPAMAIRSDMDPYARSCSTLLNWDVSPTGGISRRRGMRPLTPALQQPSRLIPFTYSQNRTYLVEVAEDTIRVLSPSGSTLQTFSATDDSPWRYSDVTRITWLQLNSILLILSPDSPVMQLKIAADYSWSLQPFAFKQPPWYSVNARDTKITLTPTADGLYSAAFEETEDILETDPATGDILRVSYYTERQEAFQTSAELRSGNWSTFGSETPAITNTSTFAPGDKIAVQTTPVYELFLCVADFTGSNDFTDGCTSPANYMSADSPRFMRAEDQSGFDTIEPITGLTKTSTFKKGAKVKLLSGYWKLYTCIRPFAPSDYVLAKNSPADYPAFFCSGIPVAYAMPCRGTWKFHCSGTWFGSYEIRRSYASGDLTALWATLGESLSLIGSPTNNLITGTEEDEECFLRLFLTQVRYSGSDLAAGWPADECGNSLVVSAYKHDMQLTVMPDGLLQDTSPAPIPLRSAITTDDWSWCAFNARYGYPTIAALHESRLVLAATTLQPQTIWLSRTDDLNNYATGSTDDAALHLTMSTQTQASICWLTSRGSSVQLGTEDGEWVLQSSSGGALTPSSARIVNHGRIGSAHIPATMAADRLLYCERGAGRLYQFAYDYSQDAFTSQDLTIFADHVLSGGGGITSGTIVRKPYCVAMFVLADGTLANMAYNTHHNVNAWHRWQTDGKIESICALPNGNKHDSIYLITNRAGTRRLEVIDENSPYLDASTLPYPSVMETTAFTVMDADERLTHQAQLRAYLAAPTPAASITVRTAISTYNPIARTGELTTGWHTLTSVSGYSDRPLIGITVTGNTPCEILAVQM